MTSAEAFDREHKIKIRFFIFQEVIGEVATSSMETTADQIVRPVYRSMSSFSPIQTIFLLLFVPK